MADVIPTAAMVNLLKGALEYQGPLNLRLFSNLVAGSATTTLGMLTECHFSGYAPISLTPAVTPSVTEEGVVQTQEFNLSFAHDGGADSGTVGGYYITGDDTVGQKLVDFCPEDGGLRPMIDASDVYFVDIIVLAQQE